MDFNGLANLVGNLNDFGKTLLGIWGILVILGHQGLFIPVEER